MTLEFRAVWYFPLLMHRDYPLMRTPASFRIHLATSVSCHDLQKGCKTEHLGLLDSQHMLAFTSIATIVLISLIKLTAYHLQHIQPNSLDTSYLHLQHVHSFYSKSSKSTSASIPLNPTIDITREHQQYNEH